MPKAVLQNGLIVPLEPLPREWREGVTLQVDKIDSPPADIDSWARDMNELCADSLADDDDTMSRAIEEHRLQAKILARRAMGLSE